MPESTMATPSISLVTPNLNYGCHLGRTISSVVANSYPSLEYIVVDGGSTDESEAIFHAFATSQARWISAPGMGQYAAINHGFQQSSGDVMGWLNSDDILMPWALSAVSEIFQRFPDVDWIMGAPAIIQADAVHSVSQARPFDREAVRLGLLTGGEFGLIQQESCFWRRRLWERAGPLRTDLGLAGDFELWMRFAAHAAPVTCDTLLGGFTIHPTNLSRQVPGRYAADVQRAIHTLSPLDKARRHSRRTDLIRYFRWRGYTGLKWLARRMGGLQAISGPVIRRDFEAESFRYRLQPVYP